MNIPTQYILKAGGLVPTYLGADNVFQCHASEVKPFNTIEAATKAAGSIQLKIVDAATLSFVKWVNY